MAQRGHDTFHEGWPDLSKPLIARIEGKLGQDAEANRDVIRAELKAVLDGLRPPTEVQSLQIALLKLAIDADFVVDSHTELVAIAGMVVAPWCEAKLDPFIAEIDPALVHVTDTPTLFDGTCSKPWHDLAQALGGAYPVPQGNISVTIEMRGAGDVSDALARRDAEAIFRHLARIGVVEGEFATNDTDLELHAVLAGQAIGQLANFLAASHIRAGRLVPALLPHVSAHTGLHLYYGSRNAMPRRVRAFLDLAFERLHDCGDYVLADEELSRLARKRKPRRGAR